MTQDLTVPRFVFGVDIDGVLADHSAGFAEFIASQQGIETDEMPPRQTYDFAEWGVTRADFEDLHRTAVMEHHLLTRMPMIDGASDVLWRLSDAGVVGAADHPPALRQLGSCRDRQRHGGVA